MASKQVRKLESTTQNEVLEIEMAIRDRNGKKIDAEYATKDELGTASETLSGEIDANTTSISGLTTRMGTAEGTITSHGTSISGLTGRMGTAETTIGGHTTSISGLTTRMGTAESDIDALESADTALGSRIDGVEDDLDDLESDMQENFQRVEEVAQGASRTFVLQAADIDNGSYTNGLFDSESDIVEMPYGSTPSGYAVFYQMECPRGSLSDAYVRQYGLTANVLLIPEALGANEKAAVSVIPSKFSNDNVQVVEIKVGDNILIKEANRPDRWLGAVDTQNQVFRFYRMEMSKVNIESLNTAISGKMDNKTIDSTPTAGNTTHLVSSAGVATALAGKMDSKTIDSSPTDGHTNNLVSSAGVATALAGKMPTKTIDSTPTAGNTDHLISSAAVYTALQNMQSSLGLTSTVLGNVTIND